MNSTNGYLGNKSAIHATVTCVDDGEEWGNFHHRMLMTGSAILIVVGTVGNVGSFCVLQQKAYKNNVISGALRYLSVLDSLIIWSTILKLFVEGATGIHKYEQDVFVCIIMVFWSEFLSSVDNWVLVFITLTRAIHIKFPFKAKTYCSKFNYYGLLALLHLTVFASLVPGGGGSASYLYHSKETDDTCVKVLYLKVTKLVAFIYFCVNFVLPAVILVILNIILVHELKSMRERQERLHLKTPTPTASMISLYSTISGMLKRTMDRDRIDQTNNANYRSSQEGTCVSGGSDGSLKSSMQSQVLSQTSEPVASGWKEPVLLGLSTSSTDNFSRRNKSMDPNADSSKTQEVARSPHDSRLQSLTRILVMANCVFLGSNIPFWMFQLFFLDSLNFDPTLGCHKREAIIDFFLMLRWSGHSVNFYFYLATGSRFRKELFTLLWGRSPERGS